ncbi:hypothetical protein IA539_12275 [Gordonia sp. zg691]|uniref:Anti-sigma-D factor RsdA sigma factor binding region domain-containing protein n=1 Tax=Gordonia jinghuaiqii TaxID=2758710 RepID=A0A7D7M0F6_9ACTN|nr:anti-sigma-D factor RsdA [Gordonia jinghuaiqii]MBD0861983.1 hypothetical protein [Gordonia jinghuaiqii]MCR5978792.1 hypothetical protein [Gordonia jinghuaiqii]QMT03096.1 hypothetical protein H1R19_08285 [Gordonia jinghuaiqii]
MSGESDWRRRRSVHGRDQLRRPGQPPTHRRAPGPSGPDPSGPDFRPEDVSADMYEETGTLSRIGARRDADGLAGDGRDDALLAGLNTLGDDALDLSDVGFDENFLDALSRDVPVPTRDDAEYQLAELLSGWRNEAVSAPAAELVSIDDVERAIDSSQRASRGRRMIRHLRVVSGAAAIVIVAAAGLTVLSEGSQPGDPLWGIKQVVFAEAASETQAAHDVRTDLERAEAAIAAGDTVAASSLIAKAQSNMGPMRDNDLRDEMLNWMTRLRAGAGLPATESTTSPSDSVLPSIETTRPDLRIDPKDPSAPEKPSTTLPTPPPAEQSEPTDEPLPSEQPVPSAPPSEDTQSPSAPTLSKSMTRTPAEFPEIPWTPPPGVDASAKRPG